MATSALGRVFLSSVFGGMEDLRELAGASARRLDLDPVLTEKRPALSSAVKKQLAEEIAGSDTYVGVFDRRRGTVPKTKANKDPRAITEWEYLQASRRKLRCFVFLSRADSERDPELKDFLDAEVTAEAWGILSKIGRIDGIAHVGALWGQVLAAGGQTAEALEVLGKAEAAFRRLGWTQQADELAGLIAQLRQGPESGD